MENPPFLDPLKAPPDLPRIPSRARDSSKRDYGSILVVGGAAGMAGAPALAGMAALRSGAGLVSLAVPAAVAAVAAGFDPCLMTHSLPSRDDGTFASDALEGLFSLAGRADTVAVGPGIGRTEATGMIVARLWADLPQPAVFDADALWWLSRLDPEALAGHAGPRLITPHAGEMRRFLADGSTAGAIPSRQFLEDAAATLAEEYGLVILLKGPDTLISDGVKRFFNTTGNPGMASGGSGDVLTGITAALLAQSTVGGGRLSTMDAARLAAWVHGRAGDLAAEELGPISLTAVDIIRHLPGAFRAVVGAAAGR